MKLRRAPAAALLAAALLAAAACQRSKDDETGGPSTTGAPQPSEELEAPLARIGDAVITVAEFQERLQDKSPYIRARYNSREKKKEFLDNLIQFEVLAKEAQARGFDRHPDVIRTMKQVMVQKLVKEEFETRVKPEDVTEEELRAFYEANESEYRKPEEIRAAAIILTDAAKAKEAAREALGEKGKSNKGFRELIERYSIDEETKLRSGDLRYFSRDAVEIPRPVVEAAFSLEKTGEIAGPIDAGDGRFFIIKRTGKRRAVERDFDEVKRTIRNRIFQEKRSAAQKEFLATLWEKAEVEIYEENLAQIRVEPAPAGSGGAGDPGHPNDLPPENVPESQGSSATGAPAGQP